MNKNEYSIMNDFEKDYWWHQGKKYLVNSLVTKYSTQLNKEKLKILEIGCGTGEITEGLSKYGEVVGLDMSEDAAYFCRKRGLNVLVADINEADLSTLGKFDIVLALDVLEHIQDDVEAIKRVRALLNDEGYFIVNVPAYKFLWSGHDEALQHKRRYSSHELRRKLDDNGFTILKLSYFVFAAFPGIASIKFLGSVLGRSAYPTTSYVKVPKFLNSFMTSVLKVETKLINFVKLPFGTTITLVAVKNNASNKS